LPSVGFLSASNDRYPFFQHHTQKASLLI
jgi:hypothetical protein